MDFRNFFKQFSVFLLTVAISSGVKPGIALAAVQPAAADVTGLIMRGGLFFLGLVTIVFIFYKPVYGLLVNYYHPSFCRQIVLSMLFLYLLSWLSLGAYIIFDFGFMYFWIKWVFVFLGALWIIAFAVIMLRSSRA